VIPGQVTLSVDVRHAEDDVQRAACEHLADEAARIGDTRGVPATWTLLQESGAVAGDPRLSGLLEAAVADLGYPVLRLPSGARPAAVPMSDLTPVAMLFVRCRGGVSHHPAESVRADDVAIALAVLNRFLERLAGSAHAAR